MIDLQNFYIVFKVSYQILNIFKKLEKKSVIKIMK